MTPDNSASTRRDRQVGHRRFTVPRRGIPPHAAALACGAGGFRLDNRNKAVILSAKRETSVSMTSSAFSALAWTQRSGRQIDDQSMIVRINISFGLIASRFSVPRKFPEKPRQLEEQAEVASHASPKSGAFSNRTELPRRSTVNPGRFRSASAAWRL